MKVALIVATAGRTGVESVIAALAEEFSAQDVQTRVIAFEDGPLIERLRGASVPVEVVPVHGKADLGGIRRLARVIRSQEPDIVHTHGQRAMFIGNLAAKMAGRTSARRAAIVTTFHEFTHTQGLVSPRLRPAYVRLQRWLAHYHTDHCLACSDAVRDEAHTVFRLPPEKITRIYSPLRRDLLPLPDRTETESFRSRLGLAPKLPVIGAAGRLVTMKNHAQLIEALPLVRRAIPEVRLMIVGSGPLREQLGVQAVALDVSDILIWAGETDQMSLFLSTVNVLAHPSLAEPMGLVPLEAMVCGTPIVGTQAGGLPEILRLSAANRSVPVGDPAALAAALIDVLRGGVRVSPAEIDAVRAMFAAQTIAAQHIALYRSLLGER